jgi:hypothetical protein
MDIEHGHVSAGLAHLANISYRLGKTLDRPAVGERLGKSSLVQETLSDFEANLGANGIDMISDQAIAGPWLNFNPDTERFEGDLSPEANALMVEEYREGHQLPVIS